MCSQKESAVLGEGGENERQINDIDAVLDQLKRTFPFQSVVLVSVLTMIIHLLLKPC